MARTGEDLESYEYVMLLMIRRRQMAPDYPFVFSYVSSPLRWFYIALVHCLRATYYIFDLFCRYFWIRLA